MREVLLLQPSLIYLIIFSAYDKLTYLESGKLNERADALSRNQLSVFFLIDSPGGATASPSTSGVGGGTGQVEQLDVSRLVQVVQHYLKCSLAPSTTLTYNMGRNHYAKFCSERKIVPLPLTEKNLCEYVANLAQGDVKHQSIKCYLPAAHHLQIMSGQGDPFREKIPLLEDVLRGIKSEQAKRFPTAQRVQLPITPDVLLRICQVWEWHCKHPDNIMLWAA